MTIALHGLSSRLGTFELRDVSFVVPTGRYGVVIGAAGSGKTTLLETIAGVVPMHAGTLHLGDRDVAGVPPEQRGIGLVYQHAYLFPHLSVDANIRYGARDPATVAEVVRRLDLQTMLARDVTSLSGGERQLVALARALARRPEILLLDEPFSALDPRRRVRTRREVRAIHREWAMTVLQVTHDFAEAGHLGDVAVLLDHGRVLQSGPPDEVFRRPASPYIAEFLGAENVLAGTARLLADGVDPGADHHVALAGSEYHAMEFTSGGLTFHAVGAVPVEGECYAVIRAEEVVVAREGHPTSARNVFHGRVTEIATLGASVRVTLDINGVSLVAALTLRSVQELGLREGVEAYATFKAMGVHLC